MMSSLSKQFRYYAFISYSRKNSKAAAYLHKQLEHFRIPVKYVAEENRPAGQKFLRPVFRDRRDLESRGNSFTEDIKVALEHSRHLIVVCSPMSATSVWVNEEIKHFLATHNNDYSAIVPIILTGEPGSGDDTECLPEALRVKEITMRNLPSMIPDEGEDEKTGWENGLVQAMSYMLKVDREKIKASVDAEKVRQAKIYAVIGVVVSLSFTLLTIWALCAERQAKEQAEIANNSLRFFRSIFLSADPDKDGKKGKKIVDAIKEKTFEIMHLQPWDLRVRIESICGEILSNLGEYKTAEKLLQDSINICKKHNLEHQELATIYNNLSIIYYDLELNEKAYKYAQKSLSIKKTETLAQADSLLNIGVILLKGDNIKSSLKYLKAAETIYTKFNDLAKLATVYNNIAAVYFKCEDFQQSAGYLHKSLAIDKKTRPRNSVHMAQLYSNLADIYIETKELDLAQKYLINAENIFIQSLGENSIRVANCKLKLCKLKCSMRQYDSAFAVGDKFVEIIEHIPDINQEFIGKKYNELGMLYYTERQFKEAKKKLYAASGILQAVHGERHPDLALIYCNIAATHYELKEYELGITAIETALKILQSKKLNTKDALIKPADLIIRCIYHRSRLMYARKDFSRAYADALFAVEEGRKNLEPNDVWQKQHKEWLQKIIKLSEVKNGH